MDYTHSTGEDTHTGRGCRATHIRRLHAGSASHKRVQWRCWRIPSLAGGNIRVARCRARLQRRPPAAAGPAGVVRGSAAPRRMLLCLVVYGAGCSRSICSPAGRAQTGRAVSCHLVAASHALWGYIFDAAGLQAAAWHTALAHVSCSAAGPRRGPCATCLQRCTRLFEQQPRPSSRPAQPSPGRLTPAQSGLACAGSARQCSTSCSRQSRGITGWCQGRSDLRCTHAVPRCAVACASTFSSKVTPVKR